MVSSQEQCILMYSVLPRAGLAHALRTWGDVVREEAKQSHVTYSSPTCLAHARACTRAWLRARTHVLDHGFVLETMCYSARKHVLDHGFVQESMC